MPSAGGNIGGGYNSKNQLPRRIDPAQSQGDPLDRLARKNSGQRPATSN